MLVRQAVLARSLMSVLCALLLLPSVVDAGQLVGIGLDKPAQPPQQQQPEPQQNGHLQQPSSTATSATGQQPSSNWSQGTVPQSSSLSDGSSVVPRSADSATQEGKRLSPRIFTFGIGPYCNHYFLKRLAGKGSAKCLILVSVNGRRLVVGQR